MGDGREADDVLEILLHRSDEGTVDHVDQGEEDDPGQVELGPFGHHHDAQAQCGERAQFHEHTRVEHGDGRWRGHVTVRAPVVHRENTAQHGKTEEDHREPKLLKGHRKGHLLQLQQVEGEVTQLGLGLEHHGQRAHQGQHRPDEQVEGELHPRVFPGLLPSPNHDEQVHGKDGNLVEEEQREQVQGGENPKNARGQDEEQAEELPDAGHVPGDEHAGEDDDAREQDQGRAHAVHAHVVGNAQGRQPGRLLYELISSLGQVVVQVNPARKQEGHQAREQGQHLDRLVLHAGDDEEYPAHHHGEEDENRQWRHRSSLVKG